LAIEDGFGGGEEASGGTQVFYFRCSVMPADAREMKLLATALQNSNKGNSA